MSTPRQPVKIVVDSPSDLPAEWIKQWDIAVVPAFVNFGQESIPDDGVTLSRAEFYRRLADAKELPGTSAPPAAIAEQIISDQLAKAEQVVVFTVASQFSSLYNSMRVAAEHVDPKRVKVIDSGNVTMAEGWQALAAAEVAGRGGSLDEVLAAASDTRARVKLYAAIDTLEYLRRGGRVSWAQANIGTLMQIKPLFEVREGEIETLSRVRTMGKATQMLIELAHKQAPLERLAILHTNNPTGVAQLQAQLADIIPAGNVMVGEATTAIGTHVGPNCLGVVTVSRKN